MGRLSTDAAGQGPRDGSGPRRQGDGHDGQQDERRQGGSEKERKGIGTRTGQARTGEAHGSGECARVCVPPICHLGGSVVLTRLRQPCDDRKPCTVYTNKHTFAHVLICIQSGGHFPPLRYTDAETQRLLTESYANMPARAGPRGTRHRKRMKNRIFDRNKAAAKQKFFKKRAHFAKMAKRSQVVADIQQVQSHAPVLCDKEQAYQQLVLEP